MGGPRHSPRGTQGDLRPAPAGRHRGLEARGHRPRGAIYRPPRPPSRRDDLPARTPHLPAVALAGDTAFRVAYGHGWSPSVLALGVRAIKAGMSSRGLAPWGCVLAPAAGSHPQ